MPQATRIHHVTLMVDDLQAAAHFYHRELGLEYLPVSGLDYPGAFFRINPAQELHLAEFPDLPPRPVVKNAEFPKA
ncbi:MAG: VOC family protein, partial [Bacteroidota bacterium]